MNPLFEQLKFVYFISSDWRLVIPCRKECFSFSKVTEGNMTRMLPFNFSFWEKSKWQSSRRSYIFFFYYRICTIVHILTFCTRHQFLSREIWSLSCQLNYQKKKKEINYISVIQSQVDYFICFWLSQVSSTTRDEVYRRTQDVNV